MRITIVTGPFLSVPPAPCGAVERLWHDLAKQFVVRGHQVTILCRGYPGLPSEEESDGIRFIRRGSAKRTGHLFPDLVKDLAYSVRMLPLLPAADILVTNVFWLPAIVLRSKKDVGKLSVHVQRVPKGQLWLYRRAQRFATVSGYIRDKIIEQNPDFASKVRVIFNLINLAVFRPPDVPRSWSGERTILYTGRIHPEKGIHVLLEAFARLHADHPFLRLRLVGPSLVEQGGGGKSYLRGLRAKAAGLPVRFDEPIYDRAALARALHESHFYCYPSLAVEGEALPVAPLEAMATGLAPVVSNLPQFNDYIEPGVTGCTFDQRGPDAAGNLAAALRGLILDPERTERMGAAAHAKALEFSCERIAEQYLADFDEILSTSSSGIVEVAPAISSPEPARRHT